MNYVDITAIGSCYLDINAEDYPFDESGIPVETELVGGSYKLVPGGSAVNFCRIASKLGLKPAFIGMAGNDSAGKILQELLEENGVKPFLTRRPDLLTNISFDMTNPQGQHIMLVTGTANAALAPKPAFAALKDLIPETRFLYLGGCFKLKSFKDSFAQVADLAKQHSTKLVVDHNRIPKGTTADMRQAVKDLVLSADFYLPSRDEFLELWNVKSIDEGLQLLNKRNPELVVVVKDGERGALLLIDGSVKHIDAVKVDKVIHASGAGDSFNAGFITAFQAGQSTDDAARFGCTVASAKISGRDLPVLN